MIISFTGDICLGDVDKYTTKPFKNIGEKLTHLNCVVNLEAPFIPKDYQEYPIKTKVCLKSYDETVIFLKQINPFLVNLANNHINDFGNFGVENTKLVLHNNGLNYLGAGLPNEDHNLFVVENEKIVFLSYVTRSVDMSGSKLFEDEEFMGPKEYTLPLVEKQIAPFKDFKKIVLFHWGFEDFNFPSPDQVEIGRSLIDAGVDLVIGNHPHVIQSFEKYKGKWIFYCLGHLCFPHYVSKYLDKNGKKQTYLDIHNKKRKISIIPVMKVDKNGIELLEILTIKTKDNFEPYFVKYSPRYNWFLFKNIDIYKVFYHVLRRLYYLLHLPVRVVKKIVKLVRSSITKYVKM